MLPQGFGCTSSIHSYLNSPSISEERGCRKRLSDRITFPVAMWVYGGSENLNSNLPNPDYEALIRTPDYEASGL